MFNFVHAQPLVCLKCSAIFTVKCPAFSFRKMFNVAGTFFWSNIFTPRPSETGQFAKFYTELVLRPGPVWLLYVLRLHADTMCVIRSSNFNAISRLYYLISV